MSMETDAQSYTGTPPAPASTPDMDPVQTRTARQVACYRQALAEAARHGRLTDAVGSTIAATHLRTASASVSASALIAFERRLPNARRAARHWSSGATDQSTEVIVLDQLAADAARQLQHDLTIIDGEP